MKRAISLIVVTLSLWSVFLPHSALATVEFGRIENHDPAWLADGQSLLAMVDRVAPGSPRSDDGRIRRHLFMVSADGKRVLPVNIGAATSSVSPDGKTWVLGQLDVWKMDAERAGTLRLFWETPPGEALCDVRVLADGSCRALTWVQGFLRLFTLDSGGRELQRRDLGANIYAWSESGDHLLLGGFGGIDWYICSNGKRIGGGGAPPIEPDELGFLSDGTGRAYCRIKGKYFLLWLDRESLRSQPAPDGFDPQRLTHHSSMTGYAGPVDFVLPGPGNQVIAGDGSSLFALSLETGKLAQLAHIAPRGRGAWSKDGGIAYFETQDRIYRYTVSTGAVDTLAVGRDPELSPSGHKLAFTSPDGNGRVNPALLDLAKGEVQVLGIAGMQPVWLDDERLACVGYADDNWQLCLITPSEESRVVSSFSFYSVQLQAFSTEKAALDFARDVETRFDSAEPVFVQAALVNGARWYRVRLGLFRAAGQAAVLAGRAASTLKGLEVWQGNCFVTRTENCFGCLRPLPDGSGLIFEVMGALYRYDMERKVSVPLYTPKRFSAAPVRDIALSPDGKRIAFINENGDLATIPTSGGDPVVLLRSRGL